MTTIPSRDQEQFHVRSEGLDEVFAFRHLTTRDHRKIDVLVNTYNGGEPGVMSRMAQALYYACATLQVGMVAPDPAQYSFVDLPDAEVQIVQLYDEYIAWRGRFRQPDPAGVGAPGGTEQPDGGLAVPPDSELRPG